MFPVIPSEVDESLDLDPFGTNQLLSSIGKASKYYATNEANDEWLRGETAELSFATLFKTSEIPRLRFAPLGMTTLI